MQNCQSCGSQVIAGAKFCRQCGAPLFVETAGTRAQTRHYPGAPSSLPSHSTYERSEAAGTSPLYQPPPAGYIVPQPTGSATRFWVLMAILCALALTGLAGAIVTNMRVNRVPVGPAIAERIQERIAERMNAEAERAAEAAAREAERAMREIEAELREAERAAQRDAIAPPPPPPPPAQPAPAPPVEAESLIYPGAAVESNKEGLGAQIIRLRTKDRIDPIREFYQRRFGRPPAVSKGDTLIFTHKEPGGDSVVIVKPYSDNTADYSIQIIRTAAPDRPGRPRAPRPSR